MKNQNLPALTSLRFFAAVAIVLEHSIPYFHIGESFAAKYVLIQGVTFFFVLSGFILTYNRREMAGVADGFRFIYSRISRVWPAHIITMLIFYAVFVRGFEIAYDPTMSQTLLSATLMQAWSPLPTDFFAFNSVAWTLSVEMFFYALFPALIANFAKTWHVKLAISLALAGYAISLAVNTGAKPFIGEDSASIASWVYIWPPSHLVEFVLGMVAAQAWSTYGKLISGKWLPTAAEALAIILILLGSAKVPGLGWRLAGMGFIDDAARTWMSVSGSSLFYAFGLFLLASGKGLASRTLAWRPMVLLGEISFSTYLVHQPITRALQLHAHWIDWPMPVQFAVYWGATITASAALWFFIEKPCQSLMLSVIKRREPGSTSANRDANSHLGKLTTVGAVPVNEKTAISP